VKLDDLPLLKKNDIDELKDLFKKYDRTNTGSVSRNEMIEIFKGRRADTILTGYREWKLHFRKYKEKNR
jgi:Ca2+-binding EF-hand superfamily protein